MNKVLFNIKYVIGGIFVTLERHKINKDKAFISLTDYDKFFPKD